MTIKIYISYDNEFTEKYIDNILSKINIDYEKVEVSNQIKNFFITAIPMKF